MARTMRINGNPKKLGTIFAILGAAVLVLFVGIAVAVPVSQAARTADWTTTTARVVGNDEGTMTTRNSNGRRRSETSYRRIVSYTVDGRQYETAVGGESSTRHEAGEEVTIKYDPADPSQAAMDGEPGLFALLFGGIGGFVGLLFLGIGLTIRRRG